MERRKVLKLKQARGLQVLVMGDKVSRLLTVMRAHGGR